MILLVVLLIGISIVEMKMHIQKGQKKEIAVFFTSVLVAFAMGVYYLSNPHKSSFTKILLDILQIPR